MATRSVVEINDDPATTMADVLAHVEKMAYAEEVSRGADLVEKVYPGALARVDLNTLNMANEDLCVLGQGVDNHMLYIDKLAELGLTRREQAKYGFSLRKDPIAGYVLLEQWAALRDAWIDEIKNRA